MMGLLRGRVHHRTFLSYHAADQQEVQAFVDFFDPAGDVLIARSSNRDLQHYQLDANSPRLLMNRLRDHYLGNATVTLVLIGTCTWAQRTVDWEIMASLRQYETGSPNGLFGIVLPSAAANPTLPLRLQLNLSSGYARLYPYTLRLGKLATYIREAHTMRARADLVENSPTAQPEDRPCP